MRKEFFEKNGKTMEVRDTRLVLPPNVIYDFDKKEWNKDILKDVGATQKECEGFGNCDDCGVTCDGVVWQIETAIGVVDITKGCALVWRASETDADGEVYPIPAEVFEKNYKEI